MSFVDGSLRFRRAHAPPRREVGQRAQAPSFLRLGVRVGAEEAADPAPCSQGAVRAAWTGPWVTTAPPHHHHRRTTTAPPPPPHCYHHGYNTTNILTTTAPQPAITSPPPPQDTQLPHHQPPTTTTPAPSTTTHHHSITHQQPTNNPPTTHQQPTNTPQPANQKPPLVGQRLDGHAPQLSSARTLSEWAAIAAVSVLLRLLSSSSASRSPSCSLPTSTRK